MDTSALVSSRTGPVFSQQGTVDWTQLGKSSVALSVEILSRLSQAGVEPLTLAVGQAICSCFVLPPETQHKIHTGLTNLKPFSSYGKVLWFGFGIKHVVRLLVESEQGMACVALCGGLSVSYDKFYCAQVLRSMTQIQSAPGNLSPSISQWSSLVEVCSGTLLPSEFPHMVEGFSRLWYNDQDREMWKLRGVTSPHALGEAISTLAAVARGDLQSATFVGGADCAWIAAVAEWVLCLTVEVRDAKDNHCLYQKLNGADYEIAQVIILRTFDIQRAMVQLKDKTCFLPSGAAIFDARSETGEKLFAGGRSTWTSILSDTFPDDYLQRLFSSGGQSAFSTLLHFTTKAIGTGLGAHSKAFEMLPELRASLSFNRIEGQSFEDAENVILSLCGCFGCLKSIERRQNGLTYFPKKLCLFYLTATIFHYLWILARVTLHDNIQPSSAGLRHLYFLLIKSSVRGLTPDVEGVSQNYKTNILANALQVMTGIPIHQVVTLDASAVSESGTSICCASLLNPNLPPGETPFHLFPGHIQKEGSLFQEVYDLDSRFGVRVAEDTVMKLTFDKKLRLIMGMGPNKPAPELLVKETIDARKLQASYSWEYQLSLNPAAEKNHSLRTTAAPSIKMLCASRQMRAVQNNKDVSGVCCRIMEDVVLQMGQWVLIDVGRRKQPGKYDGEEYPTKVYLGSLVELFSLLCNSEPGKHLKLVCASSCLFCTCLWEARTIIIVAGQTSPTGTVFADDITTIEESSSKAVQTDTVPSMRDNRDVEGNSPAIKALTPPPRPSNPSPTSRKRKNAKQTRRNPKRKASSK
ncbi:hypothetical protein BJX99DRAFT_270852 [Aspergillus californicus]